MFYDIFAQICRDNGTTPNAVCLELGLSNSTATYWKKSGKTPKRETLEKIAERFGVPVNFLLGRMEEEHVFNKLKEQAFYLEQKNAPDDEVRSEIVEIIKQMSDSQAEKLRDFLKDTLSE